MNNLQIFKNEEFGEIRTMEFKGMPYVCLADTCKMLDLEQVSRVKSRLNQDGVIISKVIDSLGRDQQATFINESNLYKVIFQSRKPEAEKFTEWVTSEVLPSIRKTGGYIAGEENMNEDELVLKAMQVLQNKLKNLENKTEKLETENHTQFQLIGELKPKADYLDQILHNKELVTTTAIAKDYGMSAKTFNKKLHELNVQFKQSGQWFLYSKYHNCGYTHSETIELEHKDGTKFVKMNTKWTQKGRLFLYNLLKENEIVPVIEKEAK